MSSSSSPTYLSDLSTCDVSDAMQHLGCMNVYLPSAKPILPPYKNWFFGLNTGDASTRTPPMALCGPAFTVQLTHESDTSTPRYPKNFFDECPSNHILVIAAPEGIASAVLGGLAALRVSHLGCLGVVTNGPVRDVPDLHEIGLPVFARGTTIQSARGRTRTCAVNVPVHIDRVLVAPGDIVYADLHGVAAVPHKMHAEMRAACTTLRTAESACVAALRAGEGLAETLAKYR